MKTEYSGIKAVLLDIEGTTTPMDFVHKTLFKFAIDHVQGFLLANYTNEKVLEILSNLKKSYEANTVSSKEPTEWTEIDLEERCKSATAYVKWLVSNDSKDSAMKELQGLIWKEGYTSGLLKGEVYPDVPEAMGRLHEEGKILAIYSSGSVLAQKLIFSTTVYGDLTQHISNFFDTGVGNKRDPESYTVIANLLDLEPNEILFLSDIMEEVQAARSSGMISLQVIREGHSTNKDPSAMKISGLMELFS
jgi:enolase-phosphatase E1